MDMILIFGGLLLLLGVIMVLIDSVHEPTNVIDKASMECTRNCVHTDCKFHVGNVSGYKTRTDLMWSPACPYYTYRDDLDDPEG